MRPFQKCALIREDNFWPHFSQQNREKTDLFYESGLSPRFSSSQVEQAVMESLSPKLLFSSAGIIRLGVANLWPGALLGKRKKDEWIKAGRPEGRAPACRRVRRTLTRTASITVFPLYAVKAGGMRVVTKHKATEKPDPDAFDQKYIDQLPELSWVAIGSMHVGTVWMCCCSVL